MPNDRTLAFCGDVMLGRGVDQVLRHPGNPRLHETWVTDAREYVVLAEERHGRILRPVDAAYPWGAALDALTEAAPDGWVLNLETAVTRSDDFAPGKPVCYRMSPENVGAVRVAAPDVCVLANNHVLDLGRSGLRETLDVLGGAGVTTAGAGRDAEEAWRPAVVELSGGGRLLVLAFGMLSSGVPARWAATAERGGVAFVPVPSPESAAEVVGRVRAVRRPGDLVVASVHWGPNWGYGVERAETRFAHALVDGGVDVVHGHSSHHPRPVEVYRGRPILYGCGDLVNDYEGIPGHDDVRPDLRLLYLAEFADQRGIASERGEVGSAGGGEVGSAGRGEARLTGLRLVPFRAWRLRLERARPPDVRWLAGRLTAASRRFGTRVEPTSDGALAARW